jgi:hypothetical protein
MARVGVKTKGDACRTWGHGAITSSDLQLTTSQSFADNTPDYKTKYTGFRKSFSLHRYLLIWLCELWHQAATPRASV